MLPVQTMPPRRPGSWGSPFGKPRLIKIADHHDNRFIVPQGGWYIQCGPGNHTLLTYKHPDDDFDHGHEPWMQPATGLTLRWERPPPPPPPKPGANNVLTMELIAHGKAGSIFSDGQNLTIEGGGEATIIQVFSV